METWRGLEENSDSGMGLLSVTSTSSMGSARVGSGERQYGSPDSQEMGVDSLIMIFNMVKLFYVQDIKD